MLILLHILCISMVPVCDPHPGNPLVVSGCTTVGFFLERSIWHKHFFKVPTISPVLRPCAACLSVVLEAVRVSPELSPPPAAVPSGTPEHCFGPAAYTGSTAPMKATGK